MNRKPVHAGRFYPGNVKKLISELGDFFSIAQKRPADAKAIISPHAGYVFSGKVAASAFNQINPDKKYKNVFVLTSTHYQYLSCAAVYTDGNYETPLGEIEVNIEICKKLVDEHVIFESVAEAHSQEHSLEVLLPFLQYHLKHKFNLVPIVIGGDNTEIPKQIAEALEEYFNDDENLFVISSDFSHYPKYEDAVNVDLLTANAICSNKPDQFLKNQEKNKNSGINNLATDICGASAVLSLLYLTENKDFIYRILDYQNSGDSVYGEKDRVVGYYAIAAYKLNSNDQESFNLTAEEKQILLGIARQSINKRIRESEFYEVPKRYKGNLQKKCGVFVTLKLHGKLRGCLGRFSAEKNLPETVAEIAVSSALNDHRFTPVSKDEVDDIVIEISILTPMKKINDISEIELGKHGVYIKKNDKTGTFLPEVASQTNWALNEFLGHCAQDKAGIGWDGWKDAEIFTYESIKFSE